MKNGHPSMRHLILIILTSLAATFPFPHSPLFVSLTTSSPSSSSLCATALPHPTVNGGSASRRHLGGGLSALNEFHNSPGDEALTVDSVMGFEKGVILDTLKVSVLGASHGVDSKCAYSMVTFQNNHPTEDIVIYSAHIEPSVLFPLQEADSIAPNPLEPPPPPLFPEKNKSLNDQQLQQLLHVQPGSTVTIPVSIVPEYKRYQGPIRTGLKSAAPRKFPYDPTEIARKVLESKSPPPKSASSPFAHSGSIREIIWKNMSFASSLNFIDEQRFIQMDLLEMMNSTRTNLNHPPSSAFETMIPHAQIHETLLANTSWGVLRMKVPYTCSVDSKEYEYRLPNNLIFMDGGGGWYARKNYTGAADVLNKEIAPHNPFRYDLYMDNPTDDVLKVWDVYTTKSELVGVYDLKIEPAHDLRKQPHNLLKGVDISPGETNAYIATIFFMPEQFNHTNFHSLTDLGFLELRTSVGDFSIGLDYVPNRYRWGAIHGIGSNHSTVGNLELAKSYKLSRLWDYTRTVQSNYTNHSMINLYHKSDQYQDIETHQFLKQMSGRDRSARLGPHLFDENDPVLLTQPSLIDFGVITTGSRSLRMPINLANTKPQMLRIMRISVSIHMTTDDGTVPLNADPHDFEAGIDFMGGAMTAVDEDEDSMYYEFPHELLMAPHDTYLFPIHIWCRFTVSPEHTVTPRMYRGSIVFRSQPDIPKRQSYGEWMEKDVLDDPLYPRLITALPFRVAVIPGNFRISTDSLLFPSHYTMLSEEELSSAKRRNKIRKPDYIDRFLHVTNNFDVPITITGMGISYTHEFDFCNSIFSIPAPDSSWDENWRTAESQTNWKLPIRFFFDRHLDSIRFSKKCILTLETDKVGKQFLPLIIHSGELIAEVQHGEGDVQSNECIIAAPNGTMIKERGILCLQDWIENKKQSKAFSKAVKRMNEEMKSTCRENTIKGTAEMDYFQSLSLNKQPHLIQPLMIELGAVRSDTVVQSSILLTNMNPAPVEVTATSAGFDYMALQIGHKPASVPVAIESMPQESYIKYFLTHSGVARSFLSKLKYKVDISLSPRASNSELHSLYENQAIDHMTEDSNEFQINEMTQATEEKLTCAAGLIVSMDGSYHKQFTSRLVSTKKWKIPPGGVARFVVGIRTPNRDELKSDLSSFIATGLILETNKGQVFPIILSYSVLLGQLNLLPSNSSQVVKHHKDKKILYRPSALPIPMTIRDATSQMNPPSRGIPLSIENTFSKEIYLGEIKSCNRWFDFSRTKNSINVNATSSSLSNYLLIKAMNKSSVDSSPLVPVGDVYTSASCADESGRASFFSCALQWLADREKIQPIGCGLAEEETFTFTADLDSQVDKTMKQMKMETINFLMDAVMYFKTRQAGGYILQKDIDTIQRAREAWDVVSAHGLNIITGHLNAFSTYHNDEISAGDEHSQENVDSNTDTKNVVAEVMNNESNLLLPVPVSSIMLESSLELPLFFLGKRESYVGKSVRELSTGVLEFDPIHVAQTSSLYIPVSNPTDVSVRVQLSAAVCRGDESNCDMFMGKREFMQTFATDRHSWWTGESYWASTNDGQLIEAIHNVTFTSGSGSFVNLVQPSIHTISPFLFGCGTRCGRRSDADNVGEEVLYSTIGCGSGSQSTLLGHPWHMNGKLPPPSRKFNTIESQPFSVGHSGVQEVVLPPHGKANLGPVFFRPTKREVLNASIYISNNLTGFEEVILRGRGIWEKLAFLDNDEGSNGGDIEFRNGRSALVFSGSATMDNKPVVKSFVLANLGDVAVNISSVSMRSSETKHFSHRSPYSTSIFQYKGFWRLFFSSNTDHDSSNRCSKARFHLVGCKDARVRNWISVIIQWFSSMRFAPQPPVHPPEPAYTTNFTTYHDGFTLLPNENKTFFVEHRPDCVLRASYSSIIFEISGRDILPGNNHWRKTFRDEKLELLVGYSMNAYDYCLPYVHPSPRILEKVFSFALSSQVLDVLSLGYIKREDDKEIVRYEVEISYIAALFLVLLMLLIIDLYGSIEYPRNSDSHGTSWKQTRRCLARADPVSADLVALGKEQTKHVLLSRFRKENVLATNCVLPDGTFTRDKPGGEAGGSSTPYRRSSSSHQGKTFSDAVFHRRNLLANESKSEDTNQPDNSGLLPCGIAWRTAARRGISVRSGPTSSSEPQYLERTRSVLLQKKLLLSKPKVHPDITTTSSVVTNINHRYDQPVPVYDAPPPQDRKVENKDANNLLSKDKVSPDAMVKKTFQAINSVDKETLHVAAKPLVQAKTKLTHANNNSKDGSKQLVALVAKQEHVKHQNRLEKVKSLEQTNMRTKTNYSKQMKPTQVAEDTPIKPAQNGKGKNGVSSSTPPSNNAIKSTPAIVVKQPDQGLKSKDILKNDRAKKTDIPKNNRSVQDETKATTFKSYSKASSSNRSASEESVPSSTPISSAQPSPHSDTSITPKLPTKGMLRSPPGLLPPPGFADIPAPCDRTSPTPQTTPTLLSPEPSFSDLSPVKAPSIISELKTASSPSFIHESVASPTLAGLLSPPIGDEDRDLSPNRNFVNSSMLITDLLPPPPRLSPPLLEPSQSSNVAGSHDESGVEDLIGTGNNFDVMNFLDGIMNDAKKPTSSTEPANSVSLDPWNSLSRKSSRSNPLAAIIGRISDVEATTLRGQNEEHEIAGIPLASNTPSLLTPSTLQSNISGNEPMYASIATQAREDDEDLLEPDSFYSQLLGE